MKHEKMDPHGHRLPIKIDSTSNGEFVPLPISKINEQGNRLALENATQIAKRKGQSRRRFLISSCGAASTLLAFNQANAESGKTGGWFDVSRDAAYDQDA
ncbi:MAG: amidohydrolase, partial [Pseudomonadota bacterium]